MSDSEKQAGRPLWVRIALFGVRRRASAWVGFCFCIALTVFVFAYGLYKWRFLWLFLPVYFLCAVITWWLYEAIRWEDRHGRWS